ncbi:hypothetical protein EZJ19_03980 [Parasulfuritortus cantonensis]|uniref:ATP-grasp domain-containing protein n=1 Tax=Parasulfuritortus cantonensis TaxID=2528202 RepID=A0A4R1BIK4_9PROT|nr:hypothetical protein [Parasulfuritortus cantonensis]TCJ17116.1 hypothetical protein EZJ19_03980 [Parasulfuritortus cantonensis]
MRPHLISAQTGRPDPIQTAKDLLRAGRQEEGERTLRQLLDRDGGNPEALGLLALLEVQRRHTKKAKQLWEQALANPTPAWIYLRNLFNLLSVVLREGARAEAAKYASRPVPQWPEQRIPNPEERQMLPALADMLADLGRIDAAADLLTSAIGHLAQDGVLHHALGKLQLARGDLGAAWQALQQAEQRLRPRVSFPLLTDLCLCAMERGDQAAVRAIHATLATASPVYVSPAQTGQRANILIFNKVKFADIDSERALHFGGNFPGQLSTHLAAEYRFMSVFAEEAAGRAAREQLPPPALILNNIAGAEAMAARGSQQDLVQFAASFGVPVINHPDKIAQSGRDENAARLAGLANLLVPRTCRFDKAGKTGSELAAAIEAQFAYPLIARTLELQQGLGMHRIDDRAQLLDALATRLPEQFFVTEFIDSRGPDGFYRKIRAAVVGDHIGVMRADWDTFWMVHGRKSEERVAFYRSNRHLLAQEDRLCADPDRELGAGVMATLHAIRERIPLDIFGIDFDVLADGRLVFYEANASMSLFTAAAPDIRSPDHAHQRTLAAMRSYIDGLLK